MDNKRKTFYKAFGQVCHYDYTTKMKISQVQSYGAWKGYYPTKEEAIAAYEEVKEEAFEKVKTITEALNNLQKELNFSLSYVIDGDTHGLVDYMSLDFAINDINFEFMYRE